MIKAKNLTYSHAGKKLCLKNLSFEIVPGQIVGVLGENGEGKSTLLKLMMGIYPATEGRIEIGGKSPFSCPEVLENIFYIDVANLFIANISVKMYLEYMSILYPRYSKEEEKKLVKMFAIDLDKNISDLSTGYLKRVELAAAISSRAKIIILDEVFAVLDPKARKVIVGLLKEHVAKFNVGIVLATNIDDDLILSADRVFYLENKSLIELNQEEYGKKIS